MHVANKIDETWIIFLIRRMVKVIEKSMTTSISIWMEYITIYPIHGKFAVSRYTNFILFWVMQLFYLEDFSMVVRLSQEIVRQLWWTLQPATMNLASFF
jgi:hypothetical protein